MATASTPDNADDYAAPPRTIGKAIDMGLRKFFDYSGRASRSEYWWFYGFVGFSSSIAEAVKIVGSEHIAEYVAIAVIVIALSPILAAGARRLHDINRSGWWQLFLIVPAMPHMFLTDSYLDYFIANKIYYLNEHYLFALPLYFCYLFIALSLWIYWFTKKGKPEKNRFDEEGVL